MEKDQIELRTSEEIEKFVADHWATTESVCYLSSIGIHLNHTVPNSRVVLGNGLKEFLRQNIIVQVVQFPGVEQKVGAVPLSVSLPEDVTQLFSRQGATSSARNRYLYLQNFWGAFIRPIEGLPRYVLVDETGGVSIFDGLPDVEGQNAYEITLQDMTTSISDESIAEKVNATHRAIDNWLNKHSLERRVFLQPARKKQDVTRGSRLSSFMRAFEGLPSEDLSRIKDLLTSCLSSIRSDDNRTLHRFHRCRSSVGR